MKRAVVLAVLFIICVFGFLAAKGTFPFIPTFSAGMEPDIRSGSLLTINSVKPENIKVGDVIICNIPAAAQEYYGYPPLLVSRVTEIKTSPSLAFQTKGDNTGKDPFAINPADVRGAISGQIPYLGFALYLFQGWRLIIIALILALLAVFLYRRELRLVGANPRQRATATVVKETKPAKKAAAPKIKPAAKKQEKRPDEAPSPQIAPAEKMVEPQPEKTARPTAKPAFKVPKISLPRKADQPPDDLPDAARAAKDEIADALERLRNKSNNPKDQE